jgi:iron complex transport system ATP-binding protein
LLSRALVFEYPGPLRALDGVDLELSGGELCVVVGPNGSGKSTLVRCLAGLLAATSGSIELEGRELQGFDSRERARRIAIVQQFLPRLPDVRVFDFVLGGRYAHFDRWRSATARDRGIVEAALERCDSREVGERLMSELSGGQRQRVLVARAIAQEAGILLVDEPTNSLDPEHQLAVFESIAALTRAGRAALVVTHDLNLASQFATRIVLMQSGKIARDGSVESVLTREALEPVYGPHLYYGRFQGARPRPFVLPFAQPTEET